MHKSFITVLIDTFNNNKHCCRIVGRKKIVNSIKMVLKISQLTYFQKLIPMTKHQIVFADRLCFGQELFLFYFITPHVFCFESTCEENKFVQVKILNFMPFLGMMIKFFSKITDWEIGAFEEHGPTCKQKVTVLFICSWS